MAYNPVNRYVPKAVYIRETVDGKSRWIKLPGVEAINGHTKLRILLDNEQFEEARSYLERFEFVREGRAV